MAKTSHERNIFLKNFIAHFVSLTEHEWNEFNELLVYEKFEKGGKLVSKNRPCTKLYFIVDGIARHYILDEDNKEVTTWFNTSGSLATDYAGFTTGEPQPFEIQAITKVLAFSISNVNLQKLYDKGHPWERMGRLINQYYLIELIKRNNGMLNKSAKDRFEEFSGAYSALFNIVPLKHIASYLNITQETLSRLRANNY
jgi:CRP/FNR family transcriptional regulator, anaerobic regulatory protein